MSIIRDLLNGITPQKRKAIEAQEKEKWEKEFERERQAFQEKYEKMKLAEPTIQMAKWITEVLDRLHSHFFIKGLNIRIERKRIGIYDEESVGSSDGCDFYEARFFSDLGYEDIPNGYFSPYCKALIDLVKENLGSDYVIQYYNPCWGGKYRYTGCVEGYIVKKYITQKKEQLKSW